MTIDLRILTGAELDAHVDGVAALRIAVFRDWPYLYDGDMNYERRYLRVLRDSPGAIIVGAFDGDRLVGAATGMALEDQPAVVQALAGTRLDPADVFYCAESVLLPAFRGRGLGHRFFDAREAQARALGRRQAVFCAVVRPADHPARPPAYRPLDAFWRKRGYAPLPGAVARLDWRDIGHADETAKPLQVWLRRLD